ncbi:MAG TPA: M20/M25/M40 family metallo-hydrolase [Gaiellales bacterium]|jgi:acetylornithine deacetylase|nr:M20/M25/M40 family metallo-hydrolase [Gaiellales bacterium]
MSLDDAERQVCEEVARRSDDLVALASELIWFDTTARMPGEPAREEAQLQELLAGRLRSAGAEVDLWEPSADEMAGRPLVPPGLDFDGRPQLVARFPGAGSGRRLMLNGHIDVVSGEPVDAWTSHPFRPEVRDRKLYGRGACDMKGGVACTVFAAEVLAGLGIDLQGDLLVATNTDEESSGAGGSAIVAHGITADAGIVAEPTGFDVWITCRGSEYATVSVPGRPGHAEHRQPDFTEGGAVNAIERATVVIDAIRRLRERWAEREGFAHPYLAPPDVVPTMARSGEWPVTYPASFDLTMAVLYLPIQADAQGWGSAVRAEVEQYLLAEVARDPWLRGHPPTVDWWSNGVMPMEIMDSEPIVGTLLDASESVGHPSRLAGLDSWYDGAAYTILAGIPSVGFGPTSVSHTVDEHVPVDDLVTCAQALAVSAMRFCGRE